MYSFSEKIVIDQQKLSIMLTQKLSKCQKSPVENVISIVLLNKFISRSNEV
jgi:hypothetical protein